MVAVPKWIEFLGLLVGFVLSPLILIYLVIGIITGLLEDR